MLDLPAAASCSGAFCVPGDWAPGPPLSTADEDGLEKAAVETADVSEPDALHEGRNASYRNREIGGLWSSQHDLGGFVLRHQFEGEIIDFPAPTPALSEVAGSARPDPVTIVLRLFGPIRGWRPIVAQRDHAAAGRTKAPEALPQRDSNLVLREEVRQRIVAGKDHIGPSRAGGEGADVGDEAAYGESSSGCLRTCPPNGGLRDIRAKHVVAARSETEGLGPDAHCHIEHAANAWSPLGRQK